MILEGRHLTIGYQDRIVGAGLDVGMRNGGSAGGCLDRNGGGKTTLLENACSAC